MTRKEYFGLDFYKKKHIDGNFYPLCTRHTIGTYSSLQIINQLTKNEIIFFIDEINNALTGRDYDEYLNTDGIEADEIRITPPNVIINDDCVVRLEDMKKLLEEWLNFINS